MPKSRKSTKPAIANVHGRYRRNSVAEWAVTILFVLFGTTTVAQAFVIPTGSMQNTLLIGDHLFVDKLAYAPAGPITKHLLPYQEPKHGDIIVFRNPVYVRETLVKRLIGEPGDRLKIANGVVYRNGIALKERYIHHLSQYNPAFDNFPHKCCLPAKHELGVQRQQEMLSQNIVNGEVLVPPGMYFAMGDNRDNSEDSRYWGFVPRENIIGKPVLIYWSYDASTEALTAESVDSLFAHFIDLSTHFFTRTRWERTFRLVRGESAEPVGEPNHSSRN